MNDATAVAESSWWVRNEFLLRRLHSLSGLVPVGAFMMVHLVVNASLLNANSAATFQANVLRIHGLGRLLWVVEWMFIFLPLIAAVVAVLYIRSGRYYVEHLLFVVHFHAFFFLAGIAMLLLQRLAGLLPDSAAAVPRIVLVVANGGWADMRCAIDWYTGELYVMP